MAKPITFEIFYGNPEPSVQLTIRPEDIAMLSLKPVRWLRLVGYGVTGIECPVKAFKEGTTVSEAVDLDTTDLQCPHYIYDTRDVADVGQDMRTAKLANIHFVDAATKSRSESQSRSSKSSAGGVKPATRDELKKRDAGCIFTGSAFPQCSHIISKKVQANVLNFFLLIYLLIDNSSRRSGQACNCGGVSNSRIWATQETSTMPA